MARLIDADELHKKFFKEFDHNSRLVGKRAVAGAWQGAMQLLYDAPTIETEPVKHGKWEFGRQNGAAGYWCTNCQSGFTGENAEWIAKEHDFCPKCGARMDGE